MKTINTHEAKTQLSKILEQVSQGKSFVIGKAGFPIAKLIPFKTKTKKRKGGQLKGKIQIFPDFDELPESFLKHFK